MGESRRQVTLRREQRPDGFRRLDAYLDERGDLKLDGQDLGPMTATVSDDGEYEFVKTIAAADIPRLLVLLQAEPGSDVLEVLEAHWADEDSYELERRLRESDLHVHLWTWNG